MTPEEAANAPKGYQDKEIKAAPEYKYNIIVSVMDCLAAEAVRMSARNRL